VLRVCVLSDCGDIDWLNVCGGSDWVCVAVVIGYACGDSDWMYVCGILIGSCVRGDSDWLMCAW